MEDCFSCHVLGTGGYPAGFGCLCSFGVRGGGLCGIFFQTKPGDGRVAFSGGPSGDRHHLSGLHADICDGICCAFRGVLPVREPQISCRALGFRLSGQGKHKPQDDGSGAGSAARCWTVLYL